MGKTVLKALSLLFAVGVLTLLTIQSGLSGCGPSNQPAQRQQVSSPAPAAAPAPAPAAAKPVMLPAMDSRYMGASKAAPVFVPEPAPAAQNAAPQQQAAPPRPQK
jgi:hypothetical protein